MERQDILNYIKDYEMLLNYYKKQNKERMYNHCVKKIKYWEKKLNKLDK